jgi:NADPH-dependent 2,4-dienoyl-CoA reductase/sulfur reductase-like enzyme/rhodanese-related sulfurtransferase
MTTRRILIVGGVAGGASAAARIRRLDEDAEIIVFDRGPHVSFANCGLPYYVGDVIRDEASLVVATPDLFRDRFRIEVRTKSEVTRIDPEARTIEVRPEGGEPYEERYDALVLSPGASAVRPPVPGTDLPGIFVVRTIPDSQKIREWITDRRARSAVVVGGGFIGLEMAENLAHRGLSVALVEMAPQVMPPLDPEMAVLLEERLRAQGVDLHLGDAVTGFAERSGERLAVSTRAGATLDADLVVLAVGVKPETALAKSAGLALGPRGGIEVDERMRSSVPGIWAVGDAVEVRETVTGVEVVLPLAGPANRQGRIAAADICEREARFRGVQGTSVVGCFGLIAACTGANERTLDRLGQTDFERVYLHPGHHVGYYPGAKPIHMKLIFRPSDGRVLGAQAVGEEAVARRIDVISTAIQMGATVFDLEEAELCYAPQFGAAKDPVNLAGMIAANVVRGDVELASWKNLVGGIPPGVRVIDVRRPGELERGRVELAENIPLEELRERADEIGDDEEVWLYCQVGQRAYYGTRLLRQRGKNVKNLSGGYTTVRAGLEASRDAC